MRYKIHKPPPPLDRFIDNLWYWEGDTAPHAKDIIVASPTVGLLINLQHDALSSFSGEGYGVRHRIRGIGFSGSSSETFAIYATQPHMMGMQFKPGGAWPFLKPAGGEFHNRHFALEDLWGADAERLHQRLVQAQTPEDKFDILLSAFVARAPRDLELHPAVATALACFHRAPHRAGVAATARHADVSQKKLIRLFSEQVGLTPKLYLRIARFRRMMEDLHLRPAIDWGDVVEQNGFYDQSHFIRDFRAFAGVSPTAWLKHRGPFHGHIPLVDDAP
ncbi:MAG: AraC family transcriptional regulator [Alphaproteobacteria bacterium]|nr:AraC family transcriptional regulator [Alphaproteobacteria bacterium]MBL7098001.1 AraC family transcriptional regulator [Alphaproteobacteria bacterium]